VSTRSPDSEALTQLLEDWSNGDQAALDRLMPLVYGELRRLAHYYMRRERAGSTLQTTAVVNEAYLRLVDQTRTTFTSRAHFFAIAATIMRRILVNYARDRAAGKRGGGARKVPIEDAAVLSQERARDLVALDEALERLAKDDERKSRVVELRYFGGLSVEETAEVLGVHSNTVLREWRLARAYLHRELHGDGA
jgi:RNA polymerase sigma factor (TIGR02999 family)